MFPYCLSTLREKELIEFKTNYDEVVKAGLTIRGAYIEQNPKLANPVGWKGIITLALTALTAIATTATLFVACGRV